MNILIAEDEPSLRENLQWMLEMEGYTVNVARYLGVQDGKYVYQFLAPPAGFIRKDVKGESRWAAQIGVKFSF